MNLKRDLCIDACVFGMGRGAGNLNLELFAEYMNDNYDTKYRIEPMLEIMDEYLNDIYQKKFWGYSLPLYLSASTGCHPNYAIYLAEKNSLTVKAFNELLKGIPKEDKAKFSKDNAEKYYRQYQESYIDDKEVVDKLSSELAGKKVLLLAPGSSLMKNYEKVNSEILKNDTVTIAVNFMSDKFNLDYIFSSNMRRYQKIQGKTDVQCIITSNMGNCDNGEYVVNFSSYAMDKPEIIDNSGLMALKLLVAAGVKEVTIAGMDGYSTYSSDDYFDRNLEYDFSKVADLRNKLISDELKEINKVMKISFITPTDLEI